MKQHNTQTTVRHLQRSWRGTPLLMMAVLLLLAGSYCTAQVQGNHLTVMQLTINGVDGSIINGSAVKVYDENTNLLLGETIIQNSLGQISLTGVEEVVLSGTESISILASGDGLEVQRQWVSPAVITLYSILGQAVRRERSDNLTTRIAMGDLANAPYILTVESRYGFSATSLIKHGASISVMKGYGNRKVTASANKPATVTYRIVITGNHYTRTIRTSETTITDFVVPPVIQEGVTDSLFYELCKEANFNMGSNGMGYTGLKTSITENNPNNPTKIIILSKGPPQKPYTVTLEDMHYIKNLIETEIYPYIKTELKPTIELRILTTHDPLTINPGETIIFPGIGYYIGSADYNLDGIIDDSYIELQRTQYQDSTRNRQKLQEILSAFVAPNQVDGSEPIRFAYKTVLSSGTSAEKLTPMDIRLTQIGQAYLPLTQIGDILGLPIGGKNNGQ